MIKSKSDFKFYLKEDRKANLGLEKIPFLKYVALCLYSTDHIMVYRLLKSLRRYEYAMNCLRGHGPIGRLQYIYWKWWHRRMTIKYNMRLRVNTIGYGLRIPHMIGGGIILGAEKIGNYCTANPGVVVGLNRAPSNRPVIGDHVELNVGCKVIGKIVVGDNVVIAANSLVYKNVPSNCVVMGVPATVKRELPPRDDAKPNGTW